MRSQLNELLEQLNELEAQLERELRVARPQWGYRFERNRVRFDADTRRRHRRLRRSIPRFFREARLSHLLTAPLIYSLVVPFALLDVWVTLYQWLCFPIYGVARVPRQRYIVVDRHRLDYLNAIEKAHCVYCGYANGVLAYVREVAARTEHYWCPIKHARGVAQPHRWYPRFADFGDAADYHDGLEGRRRELAGANPPPLRAIEDDDGGRSAA